MAPEIFRRLGADVDAIAVEPDGRNINEEVGSTNIAALALEGLPHAVAAAQYHYLSNRIGGVSVEYMPESDRKAWIRYAPPRWLWHGTAICGIPGEVSRAMLRGWHAHNGVSLGNPRLGFVCTGQVADGDAALEGYYREYDRDLAPEERLRFARAEEAPPFDPAAAPWVEASAWPAERLRKAHRNYAMEYLRTAIPAAIDLFGAAEATALLGLALRQVGMQWHQELAAAAGIAGRGAGFRRAAGGDRQRAGRPRDVHSAGRRCLRTVELGADARRAGPAPGRLRLLERAVGGPLAAHDPRLELGWSAASTSATAPSPGASGPGEGGRLDPTSRSPGRRSGSIPAARAMRPHLTISP